MKIDLFYKFYNYYPTRTDRDKLNCSACHVTWTKVKMSQETVLRNQMKMATCDRTAMYTACRATGTTVNQRINGPLSAHLISGHKTYNTWLKWWSKH